MGVRIAAAGDIHSSDVLRHEMASACARVSEEADMLLLCGDLTRQGKASQARVLLEELRDVSIPVVAVLGNHDFHRGEQAEIAGILRDGGLTVLDGDLVTLAVRDERVAVTGTKGFCGGFGIHALPDFGEPVLRQMHEEMNGEGLKLERSLSRTADADMRVVMTHYAPIAATLQGESEQIWAFLGSSRLAEAIDAGKAHVAFHGHSHYGVRRGFTPGGVPVHNVSMPVIGACYAVFDVGE